MNTYFKRFKMLALGTMAGDVLKDDVNDSASFFLEEFDNILHVCGFVRRISALCRALGL